MSHRSPAAISCALAAFATFALLSPAAAQPAPAGNKPDVTLGSTPDTVIWGYLSARVPPVLRIKSGTTVRIDTMSHQGLVTREDPVTYFGKAGIKPEEVLQDAKDIYAKVPRGKGLGVHVLTGPIWIEGAVPGDALEVRVLDLQFRVPYGVNNTGPGSGVLPDLVSTPSPRIIKTDLQRRVALLPGGIELPLSPFLGIMAVAPPRDLIIVSSGPPGKWAGTPGDTVTVEALVPFGMDRLLAAGASEAEIPDSVKAMDKYMKEKGLYGGTLTGPIYVEGAQTGDMLEVQILPRFEFLHPFGWSGFRGRGTLPDDFPYARYKLFRIDVAAGTIQFNPRITIKTSPFWGTIGVAPPVESRNIPNGVPGSHAGNLDFKELVPGSSLYIPVHVPGALLSIGDGHAVQGDGEINGGALETSLRVQLHKSKFIKWPRAETPTHFITMGLNTDLDEAARMAVREMIDYLVSEGGLTRDDAYMLCSQAVDLRVTQLVDGVKGIHAMIAKSIFH